MMDVVRRRPSKEMSPTFQIWNSQATRRRAERELWVILTVNTEVEVEVSNIRSVLFRPKCGKAKIGCVGKGYCREAINHT